MSLSTIIHSWIRRSTNWTDRGQLQLVIIYNMWSWFTVLQGWPVCRCDGQGVLGRWRTLSIYVDYISILCGINFCTRRTKLFYDGTSTFHILHHRNYVYHSRLWEETCWNYFSNLSLQCRDLQMSSQAQKDFKLVHQSGVPYPWRPLSRSIFSSLWRPLFRKSLTNYWPFVVAKKAIQIHAWIEIVVCWLYPFCFVEDEIVRRQIRHESIRVDTLMNNLHQLMRIVEENISLVLPNKFSVVFDSWSSS